MVNEKKVTGTLFTLFDWFMKFVITNVLWLVFNIPVIFFALNILIANGFEELLLYVALLLLFTPFVFFPATTAMFAVGREWVLKESEVYSVIRSYWDFYKENYKRSMLNGFLVTLLFIIWLVDVYFYYGNNLYLFMLFLVSGIGLYVFTVNLFSITVHYEFKFWSSLKTTFFVTVGSPLLFLLIVVSNGLILYLSVNVFMFLIPIMTGSLIAFISFAAFYMRYLKVVRTTE